MAGAPKGNKNAEVWTLDKAEKFYQDVYNHVLANKKCRSIAEACVELGEYEELISYLKHKFDIDFKPIKKSLDLVKTRLVNQGLDGVANPAMAIFILKNNHNMTDKQQTDLTTNGKDLNTAPVIQFIDAEDED